MVGLKTEPSEQGRCKFTTRPQDSGICRLTGVIKLQQPLAHGVSLIAGVAPYCGDEPGESLLERTGRRFEIRHGEKGVEIVRVGSQLLHGTLRV